MAFYVADPTVEERILAERRRTGADRFDEEGLKDRIFPGCNVSDRSEDWETSYRCPDVAVFLPNNQAENRLTHWYGGPDDRYARVGVRKVLLNDRDPWQLELHRLRSGKLRPAGRTSALVRSGDSRVLPLAFGLVTSDSQTRIEVVHDDGQRWLA